MRICYVYLLRIILLAEIVYIKSMSFNINKIDTAIIK